MAADRNPPTDAFELSGRLLTPAAIHAAGLPDSQPVTLRGVRTRREARYLRGDARRAAGENHAWFRWEWKIPTGSGIQRHDQLLLRCQVENGPRIVSLPLKVGRLGHRFGTTDPLRKPLGGPAALLRRLEGLNYDFWEAGRALTAGLPEEWFSNERLPTERLPNERPPEAGAPTPGPAAPSLPVQSLPVPCVAVQCVAAVVCRQFPRMVRELLSEPRLQEALALSGEPAPDLQAFLGDAEYEGPQLLAVGPG
ncbi:MAG: hypothetical protein ACK5V1_17215, partial [Planctomycetaceae bacterium]